MAEILREWAGYNDKTTQERQADGSIKTTKHNKVWAAALTSTGYVFVRYGKANLPLKLKEQIIRPRGGIPADVALVEGNRLFEQKVAEKRYRKGYDPIDFDTPPHNIPSFSRWPLSGEEDVAITSDKALEEEKVFSLEVSLQDLGESFLVASCPRCRIIHLRFLMDIGDGHMYEAETLINRLGQTEEGRAWLSVPCVYQDGKLLHAGTREVLVTLVDLARADSHHCAFADYSRRLAK